MEVDLVLTPHTAEYASKSGNLLPRIIEENARAGDDRTLNYAMIEAAFTHPDEARKTMNLVVSGGMKPSEAYLLPAIYTKFRREHGRGPKPSEVQFSKETYYEDPENAFTRTLMFGLDRAVANIRNRHPKRARNFRLQLESAANSQRLEDMTKLHTVDEYYTDQYMRLAVAGNLGEALEMFRYSISSLVELARIREDNITNTVVGISRTNNASLALQMGSAHSILAERFRAEGLTVNLTKLPEFEGKDHGLHVETFMRLKDLPQSPITEVDAVRAMFASVLEAQFNLHPKYSPMLAADLPRMAAMVRAIMDRIEVPNTKLGSLRSFWQSRFRLGEMVDINYLASVLAKNAGQPDSVMLSLEQTGLMETANQFLQPEP